MDRLKQGPGAHPLPPRTLKALTQAVFPALRALIDAGYFSLSVEGIENVPRSGPIIYAANHAGWFTIDSLFAGLVVAEHLGLEHVPWAAGQDQIFQIPAVGHFFTDCGVFPASWLKDPKTLPPEMESLCIYPEGTEGNCKSFLHAYQMAEWRTGFLRVALGRGAKVVPGVVLGSEECMPVIAPLRFLKPLLWTVVPLPLSLFPLPSRWKFIFLEPVDVRAALPDFEKDDIETQKLRLRGLAADLRERVQRTLDRETADRPLARLSKLVQPAA
jgi:1-acyl-sn-glycerol-3-phosphate acyltransferase